MGNSGRKLSNDHCDASSSTSSAEVSDLDAVVRAKSVLVSQFAKDRIAVAPKARRHQQPRVRKAPHSTSGEEGLGEIRPTGSDGAPTACCPQMRDNEADVITVADGDNLSSRNTEKSEEAGVEHRSLRLSLTDDVFDNVLPSPSSGSLHGKRASTKSLASVDDEAIKEGSIIKESAACENDTSSDGEMLNVDKTPAGEDQPCSDVAKDESPYDNARNMQLGLLSSSFDEEKASPESLKRETSFGNNNMDAAEQSSTFKPCDDDSNSAFDTIKRDTSTNDVFDFKESLVSSSSSISVKEESQSSSSDGKRQSSSPRPGMDPKLLDLKNLKLKKVEGKRSTSESTGEEDNVKREVGAVGKSSPVKDDIQQPSPSVHDLLRRFQKP